MTEVYTSYKQKESGMKKPKANTPSLHGSKRENGLIMSTSDFKLNFFVYFVMSFFYIRVLKMTSNKFTNVFVLPLLE